MKNFAENYEIEDERTAAGRRGSRRARLSRFIPHPSSLLPTSSFILIFLLGCSGYTGPRSVVNDDPAVKIPEIRKAVDRGDKSVLPQLVKDLDSDDSAVRLYAINALRRLTDQTFDYDWTEVDRAARAPSIERWRAYIESSGPSTAESERR